MISVEEADKIIAQSLIDLGTENCSVYESVGRILKENIYADRDFPPFNRVTMDGIAIAYEYWQKGKRTFKLTSTQFAGEPAQSLQEPEEAIEIMTGAVCPIGCDTVIRLEDLEIERIEGKQYAKVMIEDIKAFQNIHPQGIDGKARDLLITEGTFLSVPEIAVAVSVGKTTLKVRRKPRISIISNGDELVDTHENPLPHQIRRSNVYALKAALAERSFDAQIFHFADNKQLIFNELKKILPQTDVFILSGGVSKGKADYIPAVLNELGVTKKIHQVKQRPGKPFWFGRLDNKAFFALPGNPVSTLACFFRYTLLYLNVISGFESKYFLKAKLESDFTFNPELTLFLPVKLSQGPQGEWLAQTFEGDGSGDFTNLLNCDAFMELPAEKSDFKAGENYGVIVFRRER